MGNKELLVCAFDTTKYSKIILVILQLDSLLINLSHYLSHAMALKVNA